MFNEVDKKRMAEAVFAVTGQKLPQDDVLVVAALFYASTVREAGEDAAEAIVMAGRDISQDLASTIDAAKASIREAVDEAKGAARTASKEAEKASAVALAISRQSGAQQAAFVELLEAGLLKAMHKKSQSQFMPVNRGLLPRWQLTLAALAGAVVFGLGNFAACGFSLSWVSDAATGRHFLGAIPYLDPDLKARLIADLEKLQHGH
jgi:hypothetical protein